VKQLGHALLSFTPPASSQDPSPDRETYLITLPSLHIESLIYGSPFVELNRCNQIASSSGYVAKIDYTGKGWLSGKKNSFSAILYHESEGEKKPIYTVDGQWSSTFVIKEARGEKQEIEKYNAQTSTTPLTVASLEDQDSYESRRAWRDVAAAIDRGDMDATSYAKSKIEVAQRELRKIEREEDREWERRFFKKVDVNEDEVFTNLAMLLGDTYCYCVESDKTAGVWRFAKELAIGATPPYHKGGVRGLGLDLEVAADKPVDQADESNSGVETVSKLEPFST
jgi:hypothetical protein